MLAFAGIEGNRNEDGMHLRIRTINVSSAVICLEVRERSRGKNWMNTKLEDVPVVAFDFQACHTGG